jgi:hypothetical protein
VTAVVPRMTRRIAFWRGEAAGPEGTPSPAAGGRARGHGDGPGGPSLCGLVFLFLADDQRSDGSAGWRRGRKVLRGVEARLAATPGITYQVRALPGRDGRVLRKPRQAGRRSRWALRRPADGLDFSRALASSRAAIHRDVAALRMGGAIVTRPAIVCYAVTPPLADAITAEEYGRLASEALLTWVVPEDSAALMPPAFTVGGAQVLTDHYAVVDEIAHLVRGGTRGC